MVKCPEVTQYFHCYETNLINIIKLTWGNKENKIGCGKVRRRRRGQSEAGDESAWYLPLHHQKRDTQTNNLKGQEVHLCTFILRAQGGRSVDSFIISSNSDVTLELRHAHLAALGIAPKPETQSVAAALSHHKWLTTDIDKNPAWTSTGTTF